MQTDAAIYAELNGINAALRKTRALKQWIDLDIAFHRRLVESSGLSTLLTFNDLLAVFFRRFRESVKKAEWLLGIESHQRIIDNLRDQNLDAAREELRLHIKNHETRIHRT
jgi:DNA-binding FadR family transcriptional regulator